jgi:hypothetical protein
MTNLKTTERIIQIKEIEADLFDAIAVLKTKKNPQEIERLNKKIDVLAHRYSTYKVYNEAI